MAGSVLSVGRVPIEGQRIRSSFECIRNALEAMPGCVRRDRSHLSINIQWLYLQRRSDYHRQVRAVPGVTWDREAKPPTLFESRIMFAWVSSVSTAAPDSERGVTGA